jgi:hypothetical protein
MTKLFFPLFCTIFSLFQYYSRRSASKQAHMQERQSAIVPYTQFLIFFPFNAKQTTILSFPVSTIREFEIYQPSAQITPFFHS